MKIQDACFSSRKLMVSAVLTVALALSSLTSAAQSTTYLNALRMYQNGKAEQAAALFEKETNANPGNDAAWYYLANSLLQTQKQDLDRVETCLRKAVELGPENYWYKYALAMLYNQTGRPELSTPLLEQLMADYPKKTDLYFDAAGAYISQNNTEKAMSALDKIENLAGKNEMIGLYKADLLQKSGKPTAPKDALDFLVEYYKECQTPRLAVCLGDKFQQLYQDSLAIVYYDQALKMDEEYMPAIYGRAHSRRNVRDYEGYFQDIRFFLTDPDMSSGNKSEYMQRMVDSQQFAMAFQKELDSLMLDIHASAPEDSLLNYAEAVYYYRSDRKYLGIELARQNAELYPESYTIGFQYLLMLYYANAWPGVIDVATVMQQKFPKTAEDVLLIRAAAYRQIKEYDSAIADYEQVLASAPKDSNVIVNTCPSLGDLYFYKGNIKKSGSYYDKVLKVNPDNLLALNNYAYFLSLAGKNLKKAQTMSRKTIEKEPDNPTYLDTYAWILHKLGNDVEAKAMLKHAMLYGGKEDPALLDHYAEVLYNLKEYDLAFIYWNQAKAMDKDGELNIDEKIRERKKNQ